MGLLGLFPHALVAQGGDANAAAARAARSSVQAGDKVLVKVFREAEFSNDVMVSLNGSIVLPRIGMLPATSLTIAALTDTVRARYARFIRNPAIDLIVLRRITINGEVLKPNVYYLDVTTTLRDAVATAGGIAPDGREDDVEIIRNGQRIRVENWQDDVTIASDLNSGDQIFVGRRSWLSRNAFSAISSLAIVASLVVSLRR